MIHCSIERCVGCRMCEVTCSSFHFGAVSPALSRIRVAKIEEIGVDFAVVCLSCHKKPCLECPTEALAVGEKGEIVVDGELCAGCMTCVDACPVGAVGFAADGPIFCDLCGGAVACVKVCPTEALAWREDYRDVALEAFPNVMAEPGQKRALYARELGKPMREAWQAGRRVDS